MAVINIDVITKKDVTSPTYPCLGCFVKVVDDNIAGRVNDVRDVRIVSLQHAEVDCFTCRLVHGQRMVKGEGKLCWSMWLIQ